MKKLNNKGLTLVELLVALTVLSIFMVTVTAFVTSTTTSTKRTKRQINVERASQEVYDDIYDAIVQATCLIVRTDEVATADATTTESSTTEASTTEATSDVKLAYKTENFDSTLASKNNVFLVSKNAYMSTVYAQNGNEASGTTASMSAADFDAFAQASNLNVSKPMKFKKDKLGKWQSESMNMSHAQHTTTMGILSGEMSEYSVFDSKTYNVTGIALGPVSIDAATTTNPMYNTLVYDRTTKKIYLNRGTTPRDFTINENNKIAENCSNFTIKVNKDQSSVVVNMTFTDGGYGYTVGGTINLRNLNILQ